MFLKEKDINLLTLHTNTPFVEKPSTALKPKGKMLRSTVETHRP